MSRAGAVVYHQLPSLVPYPQALSLQHALTAHRLSARTALLSPSLTRVERERSSRICDTDVLLLLQHEPTYTAGRRERDVEVTRRERERLEQIGGRYCASARGGETTYHGPGQLVGYPLMDLRISTLSTRSYVEHLENFLRDLVRKFGVNVLDPSPHTGVFTDEHHKIGSIGIQIRHRLTMHGFSLNVGNEPLPWFEEIIACGLPDVVATSLSTELGRRLEVEEVGMAAVRGFGEEFGREMRKMDEGEDAWLAELIQDGVKGRLATVVE